MANYGSLLLNKRLIRSTREELDWFTGLVFRAEDIKVYFDEVEQEQKHVLLAKAGIILERLNVLGFTNAAMEVDFEELRKDRIDDLTFEIENNYAIDVDFLMKERRFWKRNGLDAFLKAAAKLVQKPESEVKAIPDEKIFNNVGNYMMEQFYDLLDRLPFSNELFALRLFLTTVDKDMPLVLDYTELYAVGFCNDKDVLDDYISANKIIVLTEGASDIAVLRPALQFLYPHLYDYFSFFDFGSFNAQGGSGNLVNMVKSFAGAGISNKIIALFDHDTAAGEAQAMLKELTLPANIRVVNCPHLGFAENYPTLGPTGLNFMDINGLACSIELYLGTDVLKDANGDLLPILWRGYSAKMQAYQGEINYKKDIQERFFKKLADSRADEAVAAILDWGGLVAIFELLFDSFNEEKNIYGAMLNKGIDVDVVSGAQK